MGCAISCFSRLRSEGFSFYFGGLGLGRVRSTPLASVHNRPQPFATSSLWPCLWRALQKWSLLDVSNFEQRHFVPQAWHLTWHPNMFHNASKVVLYDRRYTLASFSEDDLRCSWQARHFGDSSTSDVSCCVFFRNRIGRAVSSDKCLQPANSVAGVVKLGKFVGKRRCWSLQTEKIWGSLVQNARFELPACLVLILWFSCGIAVPMWEAAKPTVSFWKVSKEVLNVF